MNPVIIGDATLYLGDCMEIMRQLPDSSVDSVVTDPPYGIRFMGKAWDGADIEARAERRRSFASHAPDAGPNGGHKSLAAEAGKYELTPAAMSAFQQFSEEWAREAFRVLKPGGFVLSFASARTYHRMASGIEDAGFEVRDQIMWLFGSGFPKSRNLAKMDFAGTEAGAEWEGWGTALKPAHEPICMARKPLIGTVAENVLAHGTGAINIDACRVETEDTLRAGAGRIPCRHDENVPRGRSGEESAERRYAEEGGSNFAMKPGPRGGDPAGRWPANVIHDGSEDVLAAFPDAPGQMARARNDGERQANAVFGSLRNVTNQAEPRGDAGSAARFFYCPKASRADRNAGCSDLPDQAGGMNSNTSGQHITRRDGWKPEPVKNNHPTVKPTDLMAYLVRLVTPPGGTVLDPFMGSGSTGKACMREGFGFIGIDMTPEYFQIARARIQHECDEVAQQQAETSMPVPQLDLFSGEAA
ncbi:site-specific DNA-methyltransferase [Herbaspirillum huttiense]|uniref:DNA-methyltransferase n=1 Tax=Herbaspirillum huttiense TaxID=863372 RepID=UPI0031E0DA5F